MNDTKKTELWTCPHCNRKFVHRGQMHSCRQFPLEQHFAGKPGGKKLYEHFKRAVRKSTGHFKIESLECCIHFVNNSTFVAVKIYKDKIRIDFTLYHTIERKRYHRFTMLSANRYLYYCYIFNEVEIDEALIGWIKEAYTKSLLKYRKPELQNI